MPVSSEHPQYQEIVNNWILVRDVINSRVKKYIKDVDVNDPARNVRYKDDAMLTNFTSRTRSGLVGAIFRRHPLVDLPTEVEYLKTDATGSTCEGISKLAQEITSEIIQTGRFGILTDFPVVEGDSVTAEEQEARDLKARFYKYPAESIINWKQELVDGKPFITLVVLLESTDVIDPEDGFKWNRQKQYRVLRLVAGTYTQEIYNEDGDIVSASVPTGADGEPFNTIPFEFVGSEDNDESVDILPVFDLAKLNIGHLRNSADYEESVHITGQPTLIISTQLSKDEFEDANPNGVLIGARRGHNLGEGGSATFLQAAPNQLADVAMKRKEEQAVMIGAKLITPQATNETAEAARMRHSGETSILAIIAKNVEKALVKSVGHALRFMTDQYQTIIDTQDSVKIELNDQFFDANLDPNMIMAQIQLKDAKVISKQDVRNTLRKYGHIHDARTDGEIDADIEKNKEDEPVLPTTSGNNPNNNGDNEKDPNNDDT